PRTSGTGSSPIRRALDISSRSTGSATASPRSTNETRWLGLFAAAPALVAGKRAVPTTTRVARAALRIHAPHGAVLRRVRSPRGHRRHVSLLDARERVRRGRLPGRYRQ